MDTFINVHHQDSLVSFIDDPNFDQYIDLIPGENDQCFLDNQLLSCPAINHGNGFNVYDPSSTTINSLPCFEAKDQEVKGTENSGGTNSATSTTNKSTLDAKPRAKTSRSKALVSERKRRGSMKDKLYALRALVPNITKMDKASIIGDATSYVHGLQAQAKKLKAEIAGLEASVPVCQNYQGSINNNIHVIHSNIPVCNKIIQIEMVQVEERGYYTKIVCSKGKGVAVLLYKALESLIGFNIQNSNLATVCDNYLLTFILNVKGYEQKINLPDLKLWVASALLNQGFEFMPSFHA